MPGASALLDDAILHYNNAVAHTQCLDLIMVT